MPNEDFHRVHSSSLSCNHPAKKLKVQGKETEAPYIQVSKALAPVVGQVGPRDDVAVSNPFCDKLILVGWVSAACVSLGPEDFEERLAELRAKAAATLAGKDSLGNATGSKFKAAQVAGYVGGKVRLASVEAAAHIAVGAGEKNKKPTEFRLRVEFNPHRLQSAGLAELEGILSAVFSSSLQFDRWLATAKATRVDIAVDLINLEVYDAILRSELGVKWSGYFGSNGRVETWSHLGKKTKNGKRRPVLVLYDKRRELLEAKNEPAWGEVAHARLECRRVQNATPLLGLGKIANPFLKVGMGHAGLASSGKAGFQLFYSATQWMGLERAGQFLPLDRRAKWKVHVRYGDASFWKPSLIWQRWRSSLENDGLWTWVVRANKASKALSENPTKS
jgi:hypothetical protein